MKIRETKPNQVIITARITDDNPIRLLESLSELEERITEVGEVLNVTFYEVEELR